MHLRAVAPLSAPQNDVHFRDVTTTHFGDTLRSLICVDGDATMTPNGDETCFGLSCCDCSRLRMCSLVALEVLRHRRSMKASMISP